MGICPFNDQQKDCRTDCELYVKGAQKCVFMAMGVLLESIQNAAAYMHGQSIKEGESEKK